MSNSLSGVVSLDDIASYLLPEIKKDVAIAMAAARYEEAKAPIEAYASALVAARYEEAEAKKRRIEIEEKILERYELEESGSKTVNTDNGLKITLKTSVSHKLDKGHEMPDSYLKVTTKTDLDVAKYELLRTRDPMEFGRISKWVTVTPRKGAVTVAVV
tara:strand:+ start:22332 stop:22808 length:477 start_codon:yes stop_codon:yes gene_type:complete